jgi:hypothetical protein
MQNRRPRRFLSRRGRRLYIFLFLNDFLQAIAKPVFLVILNEVKDLNPLKMRDSSLRSE